MMNKGKFRNSKIGRAFYSLSKRLSKIELRDEDEIQIKNRKK